MNSLFFFFQGNLNLPHHVGRRTADRCLTKAWLSYLSELRLQGPKSLQLECLFSLEHGEQEQYSSPSDRFPPHMPLPPSLQQELSKDSHSRYPQPQPQPPDLPPNRTSQPQQWVQLDAYNERNHGKFHEKNRGSKKAGFMGMLKLLLKCGSVANDAGDVVT